MAISTKELHFLQSIEEWQDNFLMPYCVAGEPAKAKEKFRNYQTVVEDVTLRKCHGGHHEYQAYDLGRLNKKRYFSLNTLVCI